MVRFGCSVGKSSGLADGLDVGTEGNKGFKVDLYIFFC